MSDVPTQTKEIKEVDIVTVANPTDYVLLIQNGKLVKIKVSDLKKFV
jgi:hypothetical protein